MSENKRVKNATQIKDGKLTFKSKLEHRFYIEQKSQGLKFKYEPVEFQILESFRCENINFYHPKGKIFKRHSTSYGQSEKIIGIYYTPDFVFQNKSSIFVVEVKGYPNESYNIRRKLILKFLGQYQRDTGKQIYFFEPHTVSQVVETVRIIKEKINERT